MRRSFFRDMRKIDEASQKSDVGDRQLAVFTMLVEFVEEARFTKSEVTAFICRNWRYKGEALRTVWETETGKPKQPSTFRSQISDVSTGLYQLFPDFSVELFTDEEYDTVKLDNIVVTMGYVGVSDRSIDKLFIPEVLNYPDALTTTAKFTTEELEDTIARLKPYMRTNVFKSMDDIDIDKLIYVFMTLKKPLCMTHGEGVCIQKLEILEKLGVIEPVFAVEPDKPAATRQEPVVVHVQEKPRYKFADWKSLCNCLSDYAESPDTAAHMGYDANSDEFKAAVKRVRNILSVFNVEGLQAQLSKCWPVALKLVLQEYERG